MDDPSSTLSLVGVVAAGFLTFYITLSETALVSLSRERLQEWHEQGKPFAAMLDKLLDDRRKLLTFLEFLQILFTSLYFCFLTLAAVSLFGHPGKGISIGFFLLGLMAYMFFFQFFPRRLAHKHVEKISRGVGPSIAIFFDAFGWIATALDRFSSATANLFGKEPGQKQPALSDEEIKMMVRLGKEESLEIEKEEKEMIESVVAFGETVVKEIMTPRIDMVCVDSNKTLAQVLDIAVEQGYSKFPVYEGTIDNIIGIVYVKDLFRLFRSGQLESPLKEVLKKPYFVPESKKVDDLLRDMQKEKISMAIVVDEYGGTDGLVTMEDLVEEIVGEIADEHDKVAPAILHLGDSTWLIDGKMNIEDLNSQLDLNLPSEEFETLGGYVYGLMGKVPKAGDKIETENVVLEVTEIHRQRISKVKLISKPPTQKEELS